MINFIIVMWQNYRKGKYPLNHIDDTNYWHYALQLNIYKFILEKNYMKAISSLYLVKLHPDQQNYEVIRIPDLTTEVNLMIKQRIEL